MHPFYKFSINAFDDNRQHCIVVKKRIIVQILVVIILSVLAPHLYLFANIESYDGSTPHKTNETPSSIETRDVQCRIYSDKQLRNTGL